MTEGSPGRGAGPALDAPFAGGGARSSTMRADLAIAVAALLFGSTFLVMKEAVEAVEPVPFIAVRFALGAVVLLPLAARRRVSAGLWRAGAAAGGALATGYVLQTVGLQYTTSSVSAFITYLLVVLVPILSALVLRRAPTRASVAGVVLAVVGLVLLAVGAGEGTGAGFGRGELLTLGCAVAFALHIVVLGAVADRHDVVRLNLAQFVVVAAVLAGPGLVAGGYRFTAGAWAAALYTGVVVTAVAFGLQVWGQQRVSPTRTALVLMLEPVFAALLGRLADERLGPLGIAGAAVILAGILLSEVGNTRLRPAADRP